MEEEQEKEKEKAGLSPETSKGGSSHHDAKRDIGVFGTSHSYNSHFIYLSLVRTYMTS